MDKNTLSNYGWIVAVILVLAIMITMATPFASVIKSGVETQVTKFKGTAGDALDNAGNASSFDDLTGGGSGTGGGTGGGSGSAESRSGAIPAGAVYTTAAGVTLTGDNGDSFPETVTAGDIYKEGDYTYGYKMCYGDDIGEEYLIVPDEDGLFTPDFYPPFDEWGVCIVKDNSKTSYDKILSNINGKPITDMRNTFADCTSLTEAPTIPNGVIYMESTFSGCESLTTAPTIPNSVTSMVSTFSGCTSLETAPVIPNGVTEISGAFRGCTSLITAPAIPNSVTSMVSTFSDCEFDTAPIIPSSVTNMEYAFYNCINLTGSIEINANPTEYTGCLAYTGITEITGSTALKTEILETVDYNGI